MKRTFELCALFLLAGPVLAQSIVCETGSCEDGVGAAIFSEADGSEIRFDGAWRDGLPHGEGTATYPDGAQFDGRFYSGQLREGRIVWPEDLVYEGWIADSTPHGWGIYRNERGTVWEGRWVAGVPENVIATRADGERVYYDSVTMQSLPSFDAALAERRLIAQTIKRERLADSLIARGGDDLVETARSNPEALFLQRRPDTISLDLFALDYPSLLATILDAGADPEAMEESSMPLLTQSVIRSERIGQVALELLLEAGADPNIYNSGMFTPLVAAGFLCNVEAVDLLLKAGADPNGCASNEPCLSQGGIDSVLRNPRAYEQARRRYDNTDDPEKKAACEAIMDRLGAYTNTPM